LFRDRNSILDGEQSYDEIVKTEEHSFDGKTISGSSSRSIQYCTEGRKIKLIEE
jgi:hypothetical protein